MAVKNFVNLFGTRYDLADGANLALSVEESSTATAAHAVGSKFLYNGFLYETINEIVVGGTISVGTNCKRVYVGNMISDLMAALAPIFSTSTDYTSGQYVWYDGKLYRFTTDHAAGSWNAAQVELADVANDLAGDVSDLKSAIDDAILGGENIFDKNAVVVGKQLEAGSGKTINSLVDSETYNTSPVIPITAGKYICNSAFTDTTPLARVICYDSNGAYLGGVTGAEQTGGGYLFTIAGASVAKMRFSYKPTTLNIDTFVLVQGETLPSEYVTYNKYLNPDYVSKQIQESIDEYEIPDESVTPAKVSFSEHDPKTNLIDTTKLKLGYIQGGIDGDVHSSDSMYYTDYIPLDPNKQYYFNSNYLYKGYCAFYNANKEYISGYGASSESVFLPTPFTTPSGTAFGRFTIATQSRIADAWICETNQMAEKPYGYAERIETDFVTPKPTDYDGDEICVFTKILCIGDSLTDGFFNENGGSRLIMRNRSFPAKLQTLTGIECTNMGYAGYTSVQWYEAYADEDVSGHDACIIQLGVNDQLQNVSESDMDAALTSIIAKVKNENSGIKIFVATIIPANGYMTTAMRTRSQMIRDFVEGLNDSNVYLVDLWAYGHTDDYLAYDAGHLSALGYLRLAKDYKAYISSIIHDNINDFRYLQFIGTDYAFTGDEQTRQITY